MRRLFIGLWPRFFIPLSKARTRAAAHVIKRLARVVLALKVKLNAVELSGGRWQKLWGNGVQIVWVFYCHFEVFRPPPGLNPRMPLPSRPHIWAVSCGRHTYAAGVPSLVLEYA